MPGFPAGRCRGHAAGLGSAPAERVRARRAAGGRRSAELLCGSAGVVELRHGQPVLADLEPAGPPLDPAHRARARAARRREQDGRGRACFALSAVLHELAVAVPLRVATTPHAALGMLAQARRCLPPGCPRARVRASASVRMCAAPLSPVQ